MTRRHLAFAVTICLLLHAFAVVIITGFVDLVLHLPDPMLFVILAAYWWWSYRSLSDVFTHWRRFHSTQPRTHRNLL